MKRFKVIVVNCFNLDIEVSVISNFMVIIYAVTYYTDVVTLCMFPCSAQPSKLAYLTTEASYKYKLFVTLAIEYSCKF